MNVLARSLMILIVAALVFGPAAQATFATTMMAKTALADTTGMDAGDCDGCAPYGGGMSSFSCNKGCVSSLVAMIGSEMRLSSVLPSRVTDKVDDISRGRAGPPDPYPPRSPILT